MTMSCGVKPKDFVDELTKCQICLKDVANPTSLPCLHIFCLQCIVNRCIHDSPGDRVHCPVCRSTFVIPDDGVDQLPGNFFIKGLADVKKTSNKPSEIVPCGGCSDESEEEVKSITPATMHCIGCGQNLCERCSKPHRRIPVGGHEVFPFDPNLLNKTLMSRGSFCGRHPKNRLEIYCIECNENMCVTCSHGNKHREHYRQVRPIEEVYIEFQKTIEHDIQFLLDKEKEIQNKVAACKGEQQQVEEEILSKETELSRMSGEIIRKVDEGLRQLTMRLSDEKAIVSEVASVRNNELDSELAAVQSFTRYSSELVKKGEPCYITHAYIELHARAGELLQHEVKTDDYKLPACTTVSPRDLYDEIFDYSSVNSAKYLAREMKAEADMRRLTEEKDEIDQKLKKLTADYDAKVNQLVAEKMVVINERDTLKNDCSKLIAEKEQLTNDKDDITKERDSVKNDRSKLIAEKEQLKKHQDDITKERDTLKNDRSMLIAETEQLKNDKDDLAKERDTLKNDRSMLIAETEQLKNEKDDIIKERDTLKNDRSKLISEKKQLTIEKDDLAKERDTLKNDRSKLIAEKDKLKNDKDDIIKERDTLKNDRSKLIAEKKQLTKEKDDLSRERVTLKDHLSELTAENELLSGEVKVVDSTKDDEPILGMAILNHEIYLQHQDTDIRVYDTKTFSEQRTLQLPRLGVRDITSCKTHRCIYIADYIRKVVHRLDEKNTLTQWTVDDEPESLSVNSADNVLVTYDSERKVKEFTTDGKLTREISLESSIVHPWHTVELATGQLVVSHGSSVDLVHRVCKVDLSGRVVQSYGGSKGSGSGQLNVPIRLAVSAGVVFVADRENHRVLMLSSTLSLIREVVSGLRDPLMILFDAETRRLYVADNKVGNLLCVAGRLIVYGV